jgi:stress response protein YsnF
MALQAVAKVGTQQVETGRARLRKRIVTEQVSTNVDVVHDEAIVTREPITDANRDQAMAARRVSPRALGGWCLSPRGGPPLS